MAMFELGLWKSLRRRYVSRKELRRKNPGIEYLSGSELNERRKGHFRLLGEWAKTTINARDPR